MKAFLIVACGSARSGALRHSVNVTAARFLGTQFPFGMLTVHIAGSFLMGLFTAYFVLKGEASQSWRLFLTTGIMGGFITFSAFPWTLLCSTSAACSARYLDMRAARSLFPSPPCSQAWQ
jgi:protein CrcB